MNIKELTKQLRQKQISNKYIFAGKEKAVQDIYIKKIQEISNVNIHTVDKEELKERLSKKKLIGAKKAIYVVKEPIEEFNLLRTNGNIVIIQLDKIDKKTIFYRENKDIIIEIEEQNMGQLIVRITDQVELTDKQAEQLALYNNNDYSSILNDTDKIINYSEMYQVSHQKAYKTLIQQNTIKDRREVDLNYFIYLFCKRDQRVLEHIPVKDEFKLFYMLYTQVRKILVYNTKNNNLTQWDKMQAEKFQGYYKEKEMVNILKLIETVLYDIKQGKIPINYSIKYLILKTL